MCVHTYTHPLTCIFLCRNILIYTHTHTHTHFDRGMVVPVV